MKKILIALAVLVGLTSQASANFGTVRSDDSHASINGFNSWYWSPTANHAFFTTFKWNPDTGRFDIERSNLTRGERQRTLLNPITEGATIQYNAANDGFTRDAHLNRFLSGEYTLTSDGIWVHEFGHTLPTHVDAEAIWRIDNPEEYQIGIDYAELGHRDTSIAVNRYNNRIGYIQPRPWLGTVETSRFPYNITGGLAYHHERGWTGDGVEISITSDRRFKLEEYLNETAPGATISGLFDSSTSDVHLDTTGSGYNSLRNHTVHEGKINVVTVNASGINYDNEIVVGKDDGSTVFYGNKTNYLVADSRYADLRRTPEGHINSADWEAYRTYDDDDFAAAQVAATASIMKQKFPNVSSSQIKDIILETADGLGACLNVSRAASCVDRDYGHGKLNVDRALRPLGNLR